MTITLPAGWDDQLGDDKGSRFLVESLYHAVDQLLPTKTVNIHNESSGNIPTGILNDFSIMGYIVTSGEISGNNSSFMQYTIENAN